MLALVEGRFSEAAESYGMANIRLFEAEARLRLAEQLIREGRRDEGEAELEKALAFYRPIGATLYVERGEALLAEARETAPRRGSERLGVGEREAVGHPGDVVDDLVHGVAAHDEMVEDPPNRPRAPARAPAQPAGRGTRART